MEVILEDISWEGMRMTRMRSNFYGLNDKPHGDGGWCGKRGIRNSRAVRSECKTIRLTMQSGPHAIKGLSQFSCGMQEKWCSCGLLHAKNRNVSLCKR